MILSWPIDSKLNGPEVSKNSRLCGWNRKQRGHRWPERMRLRRSGAKAAMASNDGNKVEKQTDATSMKSKSTRLAWGLKEMLGLEHLSGCCSLCSAGASSRTSI